MIKMSHNKVAIFVCLMLIGCMICAPISSVQAKDKITYSKQYNVSPTDSSKKMRFMYVTKSPKWTKEKYLADGTAKGTNCDKGDSLWYTFSGGTKINLSFSVGAGLATPWGGTVSFAISLGQCGGKTKCGLSKTIKKKGRYKILVKKQVQPTITYIQYRKNKPKAKWGKPNYYSKKFKVIQQSARLKRTD